MTGEDRGFNAEVGARDKSKNKTKSIALPPAEGLLKMTLDSVVDRAFRAYEETR